MTVVTSPSTPTQGGGGDGSNKLIFSEICDHDSLDNVYFVELYNAGNSAISLQGWKVLRYTNGSTLAAEYILPNESLASGAVWLVAYAAGDTEFESAFGAASDYDNVINANGDDVYALVYDDNSNVKDIYGEIGVDGTDTEWEYKDSNAQRSTSVNSSSAVWNASEWNITAGSGTVSPGSH